jgi:hypothetical protein
MEIIPPDELAEQVQQELEDYLSRCGVTFRCSQNEDGSWTCSIVDRNGKSFLAARSDSRLSALCDGCEKWVGYAQDLSVMLREEITKARFRLKRSLG